MNARLAVCAIARQETPYLLEWVSYQRLIGADLVMIYDNGHDREGVEILVNLARHGVITHIPWTGTFAHGPQTPAYDDALSRLRDQVDWVLFVDLDEFVVPVHTDDVADLLGAARDLDGMWFPWLIFGSAGYTYRRPEPMIERFRWRQQVTDHTVTPVKSAVRPRRTRGAHLHIHHVTSDAYANPHGERDYLTTAGGGRRSAQLARGHDVLRVHHYMTKSRQEWLAKVARGRADRGFADRDVRRDPDEFAMWDRNEVYDESALRFLPALRAEMAVLHRLLAVGPSAPPTRGPSWGDVTRLSLPAADARIVAAPAAPRATDTHVYENIRRAR